MVRMGWARGGWEPAPPQKDLGAKPLNSLNLVDLTTVHGWIFRYLFMGGYPKFRVKMASGDLSNFDAFYLTN